MRMRLWVAVSFLVKLLVCVPFQSFETSSFMVHESQRGYPVRIYLLKVNNRNTSTSCEICSDLTIKTREPCL